MTRHLLHYLHTQLQWIRQVVNTLFFIHRYIENDVADIGNVYIAGTSLIRKVTVSTGIITTIAGTGSITHSGDGGDATAAGFYASAVAVDSSGNIDLYSCLF